MRKFFAIIFLTLLTCTCYGKSKVIDGIKYTVSGKVVAARVDKKGDPTIRTLILPKTVAVDGRYYPVGKIEAEGFANLPNLVKAQLPNTITRIGGGAFEGCVNLQSILMPDFAKVETTSFYGMENSAVFTGCVALTHISSHNGTVPSYITLDCLRDCLEVPFVSGDKEVNVRWAEVETAPQHNDATKEPISEPKTKDVIDIDIPRTGFQSPEVFAVVIGNENYTRGVSNVQYALNDAKTFADYCKHTLGLPEKNIRTYYDATYGDVLAAIDDITAIADAYKGNAKVIFYYAGHGMPDDSTHEAYLLPTDASGSILSTCYPLAELYNRLGQLNVKQTVVFLDACFSGSTRGNDMLANVRGVKIKPKDLKPKGNMVVISATTGNQTAFPYHEKGHGMFTYYLLDALRTHQGNCSLSEIFEHLSDNVSRQSIVEERKAQVPTINASELMENRWDKITLR